MTEQEKEYWDAALLTAVVTALVLGLLFGAWPLLRVTTNVGVPLEKPSRTIHGGFYASRMRLPPRPGKPRPRQRARRRASARGARDYSSEYRAHRRLPGAASIRSGCPEPQYRRHG